jgi:hypothetical protein
VVEPTAAELIDRANSWTELLFARKGTLGRDAVAAHYDRLREAYVTDKIDLGDFTAAVVALLREGL